MSWRRLRWPAAFGGFAIGLASEWPLLQSGATGSWAPDLVTGWTLIACGLVAAEWRPLSRSGDLLMATGVAWFLPNFNYLQPAIVGQVLASMVFVHRGPLMHLVFTYPSGRASSRFTRMAIIAGYLVAFAYPLWQQPPTGIVLAALACIIVASRYFRAVGSTRRTAGLVIAIALALSLFMAGSTLLPPATATAVLLTYDAILVVIAVALTAGMRFSWWTRSAVTDLVVELGESRSATLRGALASALGDPSLLVGYWLADVRGFFDAEGNAVVVPEVGSRQSSTLIKRDGQPVAILVHDPAVASDPGLIEAITSSAKLATANVRLQAEARARLAEVTTSRRRILEAGDAERSRLELSLRDGPERRLGGLAAKLRAARGSSDDDDTVKLIMRAESQLEATRDEMLRLARGIHPRELSDHGLPAALSALAKDFPVPVELAVMPIESSQTVQACAYFVCSEALANVAKHASASRVTISVKRDGRHLLIEVRDDGVGGAERDRGAGLSGLADRVETLGGTLSVESPPGRGTRVLASIPV
jgi:signal transduction histidine kinase